MENSKIEWTHHTFNPWRGCSKISEGCRNCYAETLSKRNPAVLGIWGPEGTRVVASESAWREPLKWDRAAKAAGERHRVFCASLADVFEDWKHAIDGHQDGRPLLVPKDPYEVQSYEDDYRGLTMDDLRGRLFALIHNTPNLDWLLLTKRPENVLAMLARTYGVRLVNKSSGFDSLDLSTGMPNVWLGVSVENQAAADERIPELLKIPAAVRFLSCEPLLGPVDLQAIGNQRGLNALTGEFRYYRDHDGEPVSDWGPRIHWVIAGGESGPNARPCHPDWIRGLRDQCRDAGVPFFFKQWGEWAPIRIDNDHVDILESDAGIIALSHAGNRRILKRVGKTNAGRKLDGREWSEFPEAR